MVFSKKHTDYTPKPAVGSHRPLPARVPGSQEPEATVTARCSVSCCLINPVFFRAIELSGPGNSDPCRMRKKHYGQY
jgi:hypothetical protein